MHVARSWRRVFHLALFFCILPTPLLIMPHFALSACLQVTRLIHGLRDFPPFPQVCGVAWLFDLAILSGRKLLVYAALSYCLRCNLAPPT